MGSVDTDLGGVSRLLNRFHSTDCDIFAEHQLRSAFDGLLMTSLPPQLMEDLIRQSNKSGRPPTSGVSSEAASFQRLQSSSSFDRPLHSPESRLDDVFASLQLNHHHRDLVRAGSLQHHHQQQQFENNMVLDRRAASLCDVFAQAAATAQNNLNESLLPKATDLMTAAGWDPEVQQAVSGPQRYKTELCRPFEEHGTCRYGAKCQFAHGRAELRNLSRHPKYKTEMCRTFHTTGYCPYGPRCHFIHNDEMINVDQATASLQHQLSRQTSTSSALVSSTNTDDIERRRAQLLQMLLAEQRNAGRATMVNETVTAADWQHHSRPECIAGSNASATSNAWMKPTSTTSSSLSSSPNSMINDQYLMHPYVKDPPPGIRIPTTSGGADLYHAASRSPRAHSGDGMSPTYDFLSSAALLVNGTNLEGTLAATHVAYNQHVPPPETRQSQPGRLPANLLPMSFFADDHSQICMTQTLPPVSPARFFGVNESSATSGPAIEQQQQHRHPSERDPACGVAEVAAWLSGSGVGSRQPPSPAWSTKSATSKHSFDAVSSGSGSSFAEDDDEADFQRKMASLSPIQLARFMELFKTFVPSNSNHHTTNVPRWAAAESAIVPPSRPAQNVFQFGRSMSLVEPRSSVPMSLPVIDDLQWIQRQPMIAPVPHFATTVAANWAAAGVCG